MNIIILLLSLAGICLILFLINKGSLVSASFFSSASFLLSVLFYCLSYNSYQTDLSSNTVSIIIGSVVFIALGESLIQITGRTIERIIGGSNYCVSEIVQPMKNVITFSENRCSVLIIGCNIIAIIKLFVLYLFARSLGFSGGLLQLTSFMRRPFVSGEIGYPAILIYLSYFIDCTTYYLVFVFLYNAIFHGFFMRKLLFVLPACFISAFASTGRADLISFFFFIVACFLHLFHFGRKNGSSSIKRKVKRYLLSAVVIVVILFYIFGNVRSSEGNSLFSMIASYYSTSLLGLDDYLQRSIQENSVWGAMAFSGIYKLFDFFFGTHLYEPIGTNPFGAFFWTTSEGLHYSNIYTSLAIPIHDFGIWGMLFSRFIIGVGFGILERSYRFKKICLKNSVYIVMVCILMICPLMSPIADRYSSFLSISLIRYLLFLVIIKKFLRVDTDDSKYQRLSN